MTAVGEAWLDSFCSWPGGHKSSKPEEYFLLHLEVGSAYWWTLDLVVTHGNIVVLFFLLPEVTERGMFHVLVKIRDASSQVFRVKVDFRKIGGKEGFEKSILIS